MYVSQSAGESCFRAVMFTLPIALLLFLIYPIGPPASVLAGGLFVVSCTMSLLIFASINFLVGTLALHIQSIMGVIRAKFLVVEFLSGLLLPLDFFPDSVRRLLVYLPFPHVSFTPLEIYLGRVRGGGAFRELLVQLLWVGLLYMGGKLFWRYSTRRLSIQGG
jgi:ABC-type uncharacterized transport system permease subunit